MEAFFSLVATGLTIFAWLIAIFVVVALFNFLLNPNLPTREGASDGFIGHLFNKVAPMYYAIPRFIRTSIYIIVLAYFLYTEIK